MLRAAKYVTALALFALLFGLAQAAGQANSSPNATDEPRPDVPDSIQAPSGERVILLAHGSGAQIYTCQAGAGGKFSWAFKAPDARLMDRKEKVIGSHLAGPTWKLNDGSQVLGKAVAHVNSLDPESVPWLLLQAVDHSGKGLLTEVTTIQRVHTHGGQPPDSGCDEAHKNEETKSSYTADYYFYAGGK